MKIAYNPKSSSALTTAPDDSNIIFDLSGLSIFAKGVRFKGTDTTYNVFKKHTSSSGGGYNGLVPVPSYTTSSNRYLREDGTWAVPSTQYSQLNGTNIDNLKTEGLWYYVSGSSTNTGTLPSGFNDGCEMYVGRNASGWRYQKVITIGGNIYYRIWNSSSWGSWIELKTTDQNVLQTVSTTNSNLPILISSSTSTNTGSTYKCSNIYANASTGALYASAVYSGGKQVITSHQDLSNYVTLNTAQTITGAKTFTSTITSSALIVLSSPTSATGTRGIIRTSVLTGETLATTVLIAKAHGIELGLPSRDYMNFNEYGGVFNFYKTKDVYTAESGDGILLGQITTSGWVGNVVGNVTGNATTATTLQTARNINGTSFNGSADIITNYWGTARNITIGNTTKSVNGSGDYSWSASEIGLTNYLPLSGGTMVGTAFINWADSGNWGNSNSDVTFPVTRGGLYWPGQSDWVKLFAEEVGIDNLDLILQFGDDNTNKLQIRNASGTQTAYITATGAAYFSNGITGNLTGNATSADKVNHSLTISLNGASSVSYNGSEDKSINITASSIGAQAAGNYVTSLGTSGNYVTWTNNGTTNNLTVPYATAAKLLSTSNTTSTSSSSWAGYGGNLSSSAKCVWGLSFVNSALGTDSGDLTLWLDGSTTLNMCIDGSYFSRLGNRVLDTADMYTRSAVGDCGWSGASSKLITGSALAHWNGAYSGTTSNLIYCSAGTILGSGNTYWGTATSLYIPLTVYNTVLNLSLASHTHGLLHSDFTTTLANTTTDSGWSMINSSYGGFILKSIRTQGSAPSWAIGNYSAGIAFGGADTKGAITVAYNTSNIRVAGGNGSKPVWYVDLIHSGNYTSFVNPANFVTALGVDGNYLTWTKNGTTNKLTIPYATKATLDGSGNTITSTYLKLSGGTLTGALTINSTLTTSGLATLNSLFVNTGDSTLKVYTGKVTDAKSDGNICLQTSIDATDGLSHTYPTLYGSRCNLVLQPRGGQVYIGTNPDGGNTAYKLYVDGAIYGTTFAGTAAKAEALTSNAGSATTPVYFSGGKPVACTGTLDLNAKSADKLNTDAGSTAIPVYFTGGKPATTYFYTTSTGSVGLEPSQNSIGYVSGTSNLAGGSATDGMLIALRYSDAWKFEIYGDYRTGHMATRGKNNGTWQSWLTQIDSGNYGSYITLTYVNNLKIDADTLDGYHSSELLRDFTVNSGKLVLSVGETSKTVSISDFISALTFTKKGAANQGIYINDAGTFSAMSCTLNANVIAGTSGTLAYYSNGAITSYSDTKGSLYCPIFLKEGVPTACSYSLSATVNSGVASRLAYYSSSTQIDDYTSSVGNSYTPMYLSSGVPYVCSYSFKGSNSQPVVLAAGVISKSSYSSTSWSFSGYSLGTVSITNSNPYIKVSIGDCFVVAAFANPIASFKYTYTYKDTINKSSPAIPNFMIYCSVSTAYINAVVLGWSTSGSFQDNAWKGGGLFDTSAYSLKSFNFVAIGYRA